jgi:hypothetical protein
LLKRERHHYGKCIDSLEIDSNGYRPSFFCSLSSFSSRLRRNVKAALIATMTATMLKDSRVGLTIVFNTSPAIEKSKKLKDRLIFSSPCLLSFYLAACVEFPAAAAAVPGVEVAVLLEPSSVAPAC